jgi:PAS domain S-box-containing protein
MAKHAAQSIRLDSYWQAIVATIPMGVYVVNNEGLCSYVNQVWCDIFGINANQALGDGWIQFVHPADRAQVIADLHYAREHHVGTERQYRIVRPDGAVRWIIDRLAVYSSSDDAALACIGLLDDITERRRADEEHQFLVQVGGLLIDAPSYEVALQQLAIAIVPRMGAAVALLEHDEEQLKLVTVVAQLPAVQQQLRDDVAAALSEPPTNEVLAKALTWRRVSQLAAPAVEQPAEDGPVASLWPLLIVPILYKEFHLGAIVLAGLPHPYTTADQLFAEVLAQQVAKLLVNWRFYERERHARALAERNAERLLRLQQVSDHLVRAENLVDAAMMVAQQGRALLDATGAVVTVMRADRMLEIIASDGYQAEQLDPWRRFSLDTQVPLAYAALYNEPVWLGSPEEWLMRYQWLGARDPLPDAAWCALPISFRGQVFGSIGMSFAGRRQFAEADRSTLISMVAQCSAAFQRVALGDA